MPPPRPSSPLLTLAASLLLTTAATVFVAVTGHSRDHGRFVTAVQSTEDRIQARLALYEAVLRATAGFYEASERVARREFAAYVRRVDLRRQYPGIQGIGLVQRVAGTERAALEAWMRRSGDSAFHVWPAGARAELFVIVYIEPMDARNRRAIGYDMGSEPVRREAMERARDTALPALSGRVTLVQEAGPVRQAGFLMYYPLYAGQGTPATVAERRARLRAFVYAPFRADDLFAGIFGREAEPRVRFRVYDGVTEDPRHLLHDSQPGRPWAAGWLEHDSSERLVVAGHPWTLRFASLPALAVGSLRVMAPAIALAGLAISLVIFRLAQAQARERARAEAGERARSRFFTTMSHELRTPVNAIIGYNDLLLAGIYGPLTAAQRTGIERSHIAARHLTELVNDVLDLSKIEAGKIEIQHEPVQLCALLDELSTTIRPLVERHAATIAVHCVDGLAPLHTDPRRVRQILLNLLSNAAKFGAGKPVRVHAERRGDEVVIAVADEGPGIAPEQQRRIFEEFVQLDRAPEGGTGLGLAISRRLAELLGGRLEVESAPAHGSTFRLVLPAKP